MGSLTKISIHHCDQDTTELSYYITLYIAPTVQQYTLYTIPRYTHTYSETYFRPCLAFGKEDFVSQQEEQQEQEQPHQNVQEESFLEL